MMSEFNRNRSMDEHGTEAALPPLPQQYGLEPQQTFPEAQMPAEPVRQEPARGENVQTQISHVAEAAQTSVNHAPTHPYGVNPSQAQYYHAPAETAPPAGVQYGPYAQRPAPARQPHAQPQMPQYPPQYNQQYPPHAQPEPSGRQGAAIGEQTYRAQPQEQSIRQPQDAPQQNAVPAEQSEPAFQAPVFVPSRESAITAQPEATVQQTREAEHAPSDELFRKLDELESDSAEIPEAEPEKDNKELEFGENANLPRGNALIDGETYYEEDSIRKRRGGGGKAAAIIFAVLAIVCALGAAYFWWTSTGLRSSLADTSAALDTQEAEVERLTKELKEASVITEDTMIPFSTIKAYSDEVVSLTEFMQRFYPEHMVYYDAGADELVYVPVDTSLTRNTLNWEYLTDVEKTSAEAVDETQPAAEHEDAAAEKKPVEKAYSDPNGVTALKGIDVSEYQGTIDWEKVKADGVAFVIVRAGLRGYESSTVFDDANFDKNMAGATKAGLPVGAYFYSQAATATEAEEEADRVIKMLKGYTVTYPVAIDLEDSGSDEARTNALTKTEFTAIAKAFCDKIAAAGYKPMIYANMKWFASKLDMAQLKDYDVWFAQYFSRPYYPYEFGIWQYTQEGKVDGIEGDVDLNLAFTDYSKPAQ